MSEPGGQKDDDEPQIIAKDGGTEGTSASEAEGNMKRDDEREVDAKEPQNTDTAAPAPGDDPTLNQPELVQQDAGAEDDPVAESNENIPTNSVEKTDEGGEPVTKEASETENKPETPKGVTENDVTKDEDVNAGNAPDNQDSDYPETDELPVAENTNLNDQAKAEEECAPTEIAEPAPTKTAEPAATEIAEPAPTETAEPAPTETAEPAPTEIAESAPTETTDSAPTETAESAPTETADSAPIETAELIDVDPNVELVTEEKAEKVETERSEGIEETMQEEKDGADSGSPAPTPQVLEPNVSGDVYGDNPKEAHIESAQDSQDIVQPSAGAQDGLPSSAQSASFPVAPPLPNATDTSAVDMARSQNFMDAFKEEEQTLPLSLSWTYGFNRHIGCLNLSDSVRNLVMYASSHVAVLLDFENNVQKLLLGHANAITCIDCSADKRWLVTADKGDDSSVIIWDSYTGIPVQTIFDMPGNKGNMAVEMSSNAKYIITLSACSPQIVSVWDWTTSGDFPLCSIKLPVDFGMQTKVVFCHNDDEQFATNNDNQVIFFSWATGELEYHAPFLSDDVFNRAVGTFSQTLYQLDGVQALTGTSQGNIVVWEPERPTGKTDVETPAIRKRALKLVRLQDRAITTLSFTNGYIITGDITGAIKFYDSNLDLFSWHNNTNSVQMGPVTSISFKYDPDFNTELLADSNIYPTDATIAGNPFIVRDFLVSTKHAEIFSVHADGSSVDMILHEHDAAVHAIAVSSTKPWICIGSYAGLVKIWDYEAKQCVVTRVFEKGNNIQCLTFDALGLQLAIGMTNGSVHVLDAISLTDSIVKPFRYARDAVTHIAFSHNSKYLATADADMATTVFVDNPTEGWKYLGRYRAHYKPIKDLSFGMALDTNLPRLLTLGQDRSLVEYDLINSSKDDLRLISIDRIEQNAVPSCLAWYPDVTKESFLVMANDRYKYKLFNTTTKMCRKTLLAPTYGSCVQKMLPIPDDKSDKKTRLLSYITKYKVGLQILPLDGNPHKSIAVVAHPSGISHLATSHDGKYLFTAGGKDSCVHMWSVSVNALEAAASLGGKGLTPFYGLLEGGRDGELFTELENYFYFAQLRSQGLDTTEKREVSTVIPLDQIPFLMRALGFYPSEQEVEDMLNEVKFSEYVETGQYVSEINLGDFIKLYVNHRPAFGLSPDEIEKAFKILGTSSSGGEPCIDKQQLFNILQRRGEHMTEHELSKCLATLLGITSEGGSTEYELDPDNDVLGKYLEEILPERVTATMFSDEILGLPLNEA